MVDAPQQEMSQRDYEVIADIERRHPDLRSISAQPQNGRTEPPPENVGGSQKGQSK